MTESKQSISKKVNNVLGLGRYVYGEKGFINVKDRSKFCGPMELLLFPCQRIYDT